MLPVPAPRSSSRNRTLVNDDNSDDQERPRRSSREISPRRNGSPVLRSASSRVDENNSGDEQPATRPMPGKKKKLIGAGRHRAPGDNLPPLAPSSAASRREDFPQTKGPPVSTPRPQPVVAQWAITKQIPPSSAEKLTSIASDNELDNDDERNKLSKRITSPHPITTNRINNERKNQMMTRDNDDDDDDTPRRSSPMSKPRSRFDGDDDKYGEKSKTTRPKGEEERYSRQRYDRNDEDDDNDRNETYQKRPSSSTRKSTNGGSSSRSHPKTNGNMNDDE